MTMYDSVIFDLDGTLWDSTPEVADAFNEVLKEKYPEITDEVNADVLKSLFGLPLDEIGVKLFKSVSHDQAIKAIRECCDYETEYLAKTGARLFEGLEETLKELQKQFKLYIVSNCQAGYIECFLEVYPNLKPYFLDFECPGNSGKLKADNIKLIMERNNLQNPVYVGDTQGDANASKTAGVPFIYARYGFGDVKEYDMAVDSLSELVPLLMK